MARLSATRLLGAIAVDTAAAQEKLSIVVFGAPSLGAFLPPVMLMQGRDPFAQ